jgi:hypothetical protein
VRAEQSSARSLASTHPVDRFNYTLSLTPFAGPPRSLAHLVKQAWLMEILSHLPLDDNAISERLGVSRQQVISSRAIQERQ